MLLNITEMKIQQAQEMLNKTVEQKVKHSKEINFVSLRKKDM